MPTNIPANPNQRIVLLLRVVMIKRTINNGLDVDGNLVEDEDAGSLAQRKYHNKDNPNQEFFTPPCDVYYTKTQIPEIDSRADTPQEALDATVNWLKHFMYNRHKNDNRLMKQINELGICYCKEEEYCGNSIDTAVGKPTVPDKPVPYLAVYPILL